MGPSTQPDPIGLDGGLNLFGYAGGDPINRADPMGTCARAAGGDGKTLSWDDCPEGSEGADYYANRLGDQRQTQYVAPEIFKKDTKLTLDYTDAEGHVHAFDLYGATFYRRRIVKKHKMGIDAIYSIWIGDDTRVVAHTRVKSCS